ncbi:RecB family exonuclease [Sporosarcina sp. FSL W7-1283]|uniref:RecB family exonuclease n=1 Tax=Sporosarcina sp. FSL W7-1283 TaxID=2921560 RepID=UPI0030FC238C
MYSISRINTFNTCEYEYYNTYIKKNRGIGNVYSEVGTWIHDTIEDAYRQQNFSKSELIDGLHVKLMELDFLGIDFPNDSIKESFTKDVDAFMKSFSLLDGEFTLEKMFITNINEDIILLGYIDAIQKDRDGKYHIIDWKTSSKFTGKKLQEAGRQLLVYKLGIEQNSDIKVESVKWAMLKYIYVCWVQKNGKVKKKMVNRGKLIKDMRKAFEKDMLNSGMDDIEVQLLLAEAENNNNYDNLPEVIKEKYWTEDCFVEYDSSEDQMQEMKGYIIDTVSAIQNKHVDDESDWNPVDFKRDGTFYCNTLCSHRMSCNFIKDWNSKNKSRGLF